jgi:hypothetical protein
MVLVMLLRPQGLLGETQIPRSRSQEGKQTAEKPSVDLRT